VANPENPGLAEDSLQCPVELLRRGKVIAEGFLDYDASALGAARIRQLFDGGSEQNRRDGQVMRWPLRPAEFPPECLKGSGVRVVTTHITEQTAQLVESLAVDAPVLFDTLPRTRPQLV